MLGGTARRVLGHGRAGLMSFVAKLEQSHVFNRLGSRDTTRGAAWFFSFETTSGGLLKKFYHLEQFKTQGGGPDHRCSSPKPIAVSDRLCMTALPCFKSPKSIQRRRGEQTCESSV